MTERRRKKWTLMFFFASDNILSPSMLTQIKAIKAAGYQKDTNVLLHFDPNEKGAPTRIFGINSERDGESRIGDCSGPLVSVLTDNDITPKDKLRDEIDAVDATSALEEFITLGRAQYPAEHYMLFLVGHGMVVGRDAFLPDDNPISAIKLKDLGDMLQRFSDAEKENRGGVLELIAMHSCSMSGVEVAYQLKGTANYMLASQGISFIGAWPYRQLLITLYNAIEGESADGSSAMNVLEVAEKMHDLSIQHSADFMVGGYSADICLCTLNPDNVQKLDEPITSLGAALKDGLADPRCRDLILLAHWKSQSYWQETYTDLYDFCLCLRRLIVDMNETRPAATLHDVTRPVRRHDKLQKAIQDACESVTKMLAPNQTGPVIRADFIGAGTQYSHGLSIYFPWSEPVQDKYERALTNYGTYVFNETCAWLDFLKEYFKQTQRMDRLSEDRHYNDVDLSYDTPEYEHALKSAQDAFGIPGLAGAQSVPSATLDGKVSPPDSGGGCVCPSVKNYSREFLMSRGPSLIFGHAGKSSGTKDGSADKAAA